MGLILFEIMIRLYFMSIFFVYSLLYCYIGVKKNGGGCWILCILCKWNVKMMFVNCYINVKFKF